MTSLRKHGDIALRASYVDAPETMALSTCGRYVVLTTEGGKSASTVIPIPEEEFRTAENADEIASGTGVN